MTGLNGLLFWMLCNPSLQTGSSNSLQFLLINIERFVLSVDECDRDRIIDSASVIDVVTVMNSSSKL